MKRKLVISLVIAAGMAAFAVAAAGSAAAATAAAGGIQQGGVIPLSGSTALPPFGQPLGPVTSWTGSPSGHVGVALQRRYLHRRIRDGPARQRVGGERLHRDALGCRRTVLVRLRRQAGGDGAHHPLGRLRLALGLLDRESQPSQRRHRVPRLGGKHRRTARQSLHRDPQLSRSVDGFEGAGVGALDGRLSAASHPPEHDEQYEHGDRDPQIAGAARRRYADHLPATVSTTLPVFCFVSTYRVASTTSSSG